MPITTLVFGAHEWQRKLSRSCSVIDEEKRRAPAEDVAIWMHREGVRCGMVAREGWGRSRAWMQS